MVTLSSVFQSVGSAAVTALGPLFAFISAPVTSVTTFLSSLGPFVSTIPSALPLAGLSGSTSFGLPPIEIVQPILSFLGGVAEYIVVAAMPIFSVFLTLLAVLAALIPVAIGMLIGVLAGAIPGGILAFVTGLATGWIGFLITPTLEWLVVAPVAFFLAYGLGALGGMLVWLAMISLALPSSGAVSAPVMSFGNNLPVYFLNLLYLGVLAPFVMLFNATLFTIPVLIPFILFWMLLTIVLNIPLWGVFIGDIGVTVLFAVSLLVLVPAILIISVPLTAIGTIVGLLVLEIPILLLASGMTSLNLLIPGPTSIGNISGTASATASDSVFGSLGSTGLTAAATVPVVGIGAGATAIMALSTGSLALLGTTAFIPIGTASAGLLTLISSLPGTALSMLAIPSQAISVSIGTLTGSTGMLTDMTGNRAIHAAIRILQ